MNINDPQLSEYQRDFVRLNVGSSADLKRGIGTYLYLAFLGGIITWLVESSLGHKFPVYVDNLGVFALAAYVIWSVLTTLLFMCLAIGYYSENMKKNYVDDGKVNPKKFEALTISILKMHVRFSLWRIGFAVVDLGLLTGAIMGGMFKTSVVLFICNVIQLFCHLGAKNKAMEMLKSLKP